MHGDFRSPANLRPHFKFLAIDSRQGQIRLLDIEPGQYGEPIRCSYRIVSVDDGVPYHTLSYVWGGPQETSFIFVEGVEVGVRDTLLDALQRIRHESENRLLWVDLLCINQEDGVEKAAQVDMMHHIYSKCKRCVIWMGHIDATALGLGESEALDAAKAGLDAIRLIADDKEASLPQNLSSESDQILAGKGIKLLMAAPWWSRIWTVQEATSSHDSVVFWGPLCMSWHYITAAAEKVVNGESPMMEQLDFGYDLTFFTAPVMGLIIGSQWAVNPESSLFMLWRFRYRDSTDPRDKVYVILNLIARGMSPLPSVPSSDYLVDTALLFRRVMLDLLRGEQWLRPLIGLRGEKKNTPGLPSWVIDWSIPCDGPQIARFWPHTAFWPTCEAASGLSVLDVDGLISSEYGDDVLNLKGVFFDTVLSRSDIITEEAARAAAEAAQKAEEEEGEDDEDEDEDEDEEEDEDEDEEKEEDEKEGENKELEEEEEKESENEDNVQIHELSAELIAKALIEEPRHRIISEVYWREVLYDLLGGFYADENTKTEGQSAAGYWREEMLMNQRLFITKNGAVGLGPSTTSAGDEVWILRGGNLPFLLCPIQAKDVRVKGRDPSDDYTFRGDVFVPGIMDGEAVGSRIEDERTVHIH
ncbi:HET-domain-containing protein [Xylaria nigripes]|nr:HET-domain-containing protein [Xylaria nigripes]